MRGVDSQNVNPAENCVKCGACTVVCPVYRIENRESLAARGKMHLLTTKYAADPGPCFEDIFSHCLLCGACERVCPRKLPLTELVVQARSCFHPFYGRHGVRKALARSALGRPRLLEGLVRAGITLQRLNALPRESGLRLKLALVEPRGRNNDRSRKASPSAPGEVSGIPYFVGCFGRYVQPSIARATARLTRSTTGSDIFTPEEQTCCGLAAWSAGKMDMARSLAKKNINAFAATTGPILTSCASCSSHLLRYPELFAGDPAWEEKARVFTERVTEFSSFFVGCTQTTLKASGEQRLLFHDSCHLRFSAEGRENPRRILDAVVDAQRVENADGPHCCGQGGLFHVGYPETAAAIAERALSGILAARPDFIVTTCSGCLMQWQQELAGRDLSIKAHHLAVYLSACLPKEE